MHRLSAVKVLLVFVEREICVWLQAHTGMSCANFLNNILRGMPAHWRWQLLRVVCAVPNGTNTTYWAPFSQYGASE